MSAYQIFEQKSKEYDDWYQKNPFIYQSELAMFRELIDDPKNSLEVGIGSGKFAGPLGITNGIDPSQKMLDLCRQNYPQIDILKATAESLPFSDSSFDLILMTTTICFLDDPDKAFSEISRVTKPAGILVCGFVDRDSFLGKQYQVKAQNKDSFYAGANFWSLDRLKSILENYNFKITDIKQTIFNLPSEIKETQTIKTGSGQGSFVGIKAVKGAK
jgi:ubiquinone/menaquinone biosynthesis C-methylase UbiE